jgi:hypothetical protein
MSDIFVSVNKNYSKEAKRRLFRNLTKNYGIKIKVKE